jgi:2-polyprenyl-6-methoxyphenol hydroxylase-like FAD-dependent oxidoreductase
MMSMQSATAIRTAEPPVSVQPAAPPGATDVLIVGAGPTGLALANVLANEGIDFALVEKLAQGQNASRAAVIHAHTLEMLDAIGVSEELSARAIRLERFSICDRDRTLMRLSFDDLPTHHPYLLMISQTDTEQILERHLVARGGEVHRGWTVEEVRQDGARAYATVTGADGTRQTIAARYVVAADGMHSTVRKATGIGFEGETYGHSFMLADVALEWGHGRDDVRLFFSPAGLVVVAPLPGGTYRIVATVDEAPEHPTVADVQALLDARGPVDGPAVVTRVLWGSRFRVHHRLADSYRDGRLLLMGDAAHVHSPAGGQGMNTGLVDASVLGRMLVSALRDPARADEVLDQYGRIRRPAAQHVLKLAGRLTHAATLQGVQRRRLRNFVLSTLGRFARVRRKLALNLSGLSRRDAVWPPAQGGNSGRSPTT